jgi:hypothetical protein
MNEARCLHCRFFPTHLLAWGAGLAYGQNTRPVPVYCYRGRFVHPGDLEGEIRPCAYFEREPGADDDLGEYDTLPLPRYLDFEGGGG